MFALMTGLAWFMSVTSFAGEVVTPAPAETEVEIKIGYEVKDRELVAVDSDNKFVAGEKLVAWTKVVGLDAGFMQHVWYRNGVEIARHDLPVGSARRWRSWSRQLVRAGHYEVKVLSPDGQELASESFDVAPGSAGS